MYSFALNQIIFVSKIGKHGKITKISDDDVITVEIDGIELDFLPSEIINSNNEQDS